MAKPELTPKRSRAGAEQSRRRLSVAQGLPQGHRLGDGNQAGPAHEPARRRRRGLWLADLHLFHGQEAELCRDRRFVGPGGQGPAGARRRRGRESGAVDAQLPDLRRFLSRDPQGRRHGRQLQSPVQPGGDRTPGPRQRHQGHGDARSCRHLRQGRGAARERRPRQGGGGKLRPASAEAEGRGHEASPRAEARPNRQVAAEGQDRRRERPACQ